MDDVGTQHHREKNIRVIFGPLDRIREDKLLTYFTIRIP